MTTNVPPCEEVKMVFGVDLSGQTVYASPNSGNHYYFAGCNLIGARLIGYAKLVNCQTEGMAFNPERVHIVDCQADDKVECQGET